MNRKQQRAKLRQIGQMVRDAKPVPEGTILGDGTHRMIVTGYGWYSMDGDRSEKPVNGWEFQYEGELVRYNNSIKRVERRRNTRGETMDYRIIPQCVCAVMIPLREVA